MKSYVNGKKVVRKKGEGKVVGAFPDVCLSPPGPPAGPVPVPYAVTSYERDLRAGARTVEVDGEPVGLGQESYYASTPLGDEAATKSLGGNVLTHTTGGKTYFAAWSLDVKAEGQGVLRHLDLTTSNHGSYPGGTPPFPHLSEAEHLALQRVEEGQCPCCGQESCPAAFLNGEEPLSLEEFYGVDTSPERRKKFTELSELKQELCTCNGSVFPEPPCDVFRSKDEKRYAAIVQAWESARVKESYRQWYWETTGVKLKNSVEFLNKFLSQRDDAEAIRKAAKASSGETQSNSKLRADRKLYDELKNKAKRLERINHLVPKEAGGCPTNPRNLQPQQTLCDTCQEIDQFFTDYWQGR